MTRRPKSVAIIGAGIAGLSAGCYAQMNGYSSRIYEMHTVPGGLMTAWDRRGFTIDYCIHWLFGSRPGSAMYPLWEEVGLIQGLELVYVDRFLTVECTDGRTVTFWCDLDRLEKELCSFSPADADLIKEMVGDARRLLGKDMPMDLPPREMMSLRQSAKAAAAMFPFMRPYRKWSKVSGTEVAARFKDPALAEVFRALWPPEMNFFFMIVNMARMSARSDGYPLGGSLPMARNVERRYLDLGGELRCGTRVEKVLVESGPDGDRAVGVRLADGTEERTDVVVSAADGYATIFDMLDGRYVGETFRKLFDAGTTFPALLFLGIGIEGTLDGYEPAVSGISLPFTEPLVAGSATKDRMTLHPYTHDPRMAPDGKTVMTAMIEADPDYWCGLREGDRGRYRAEKQRVADVVVAELDRRWPGLAERVEMLDVATPATTVRYTGNWKGSFEGWLATPEYSSGELPKTLPGLAGFYMAGQWVAPGGGLPPGVMTARQVQQLICKADGVEFRTSVPEG